ncbi:MFS transporter [Actinomadura madurae]|uniref:MFS transporter n=1 Tax=Actinomadura madurae TaxID=1993 RepID=UPI000D96D1B8|nr:MFS transporter [Actinomadura madurae]MCP9951265.1 MFS transporter [Actinomadura madurae]MCP9968035.1 MFS transporter [Actinomadura madurae]MCQ0016692.1 MFS transporter [Actinomadura madurae]URN07468.1 MFS transporter [Actinomadura madurae]SPT51671.1 Uncharacterised protein [Actinomadura madurae]
MELWSVVRWVRAASFAATCAGLAAAGHLLGGGSVGRLALPVCFAVTFVPALALTRRERTLATILPAVAVCQTVLHTLLAQMSPGHAMPAGAGAAPHMAGEMQGMHGESSGFGMLLMHAVAVLVTSWWLECGESRLCALVRRVAGWALRAIVRLRPVPVHGPARVVRPRRRVRAPLQASALRHVMARRGPPAGLAALA